jgi:hypothetical protein
MKSVREYLSHKRGKTHKCVQRGSDMNFSRDVGGIINIKIRAIGFILLKISSMAPDVWATKAKIKMKSAAHQESN